MKFMALGGTDYVGASCYYLELGGQRFLLDCGGGTDPRHGGAPDFDALLRQELFALDRLDGVILSHGHYDHVGGLETLRQLGCEAPVYATGLTIGLMDALLVDKQPLRSRERGWERVSMEMRNTAEVRHVTPVCYGVPIQKGEVKITFYPAGHVPGAAMVYLESPEGSVLYTGDFKKESFGLTGGMALPEGLRADTLILCGTHARHPNYVPVQTLEEQAVQVRRLLEQGRAVHLRVCQLTKGMETAHWISRRVPEAEIYLDRDTWNLGEKLEEANHAAMLPNFRRESGQKLAQGVTIGGRPAHPWEIGMQVNISLHAVYRDCEELVDRLRPGTVFLVHAPRDTRHLGGDDALARRFAPNTVFVDPVCGHLYSNEPV